MPVTLEETDGVGVVTLDRPDVLNAFDDKLGAEFLETLEHVTKKDDIRCVVITGAGRAFCSGEDLGALAEGYEQGLVPELGRTLVERYNPMIRAIRSMPKPVVAALNGVAAGAGASLALACDFRIASEHAKLVVAFVNVGLIPDSGALWFLTKTLGTARAWELAATGRPVTASEARDLGLVHQVVPPDDFEHAWSSFADRLAHGPTKAYAITKRLLYSATDRSLDEQLEAEVEAQTEAGRTHDHLEGVQAFLNKRKPNFEGR